MRWLVLGLMAINLAFLGLQLSREARPTPGQGDERPAEAPADGTPRLLLLTEADQATLRPRRAGVVAAQAATTPPEESHGSDAKPLGQNGQAATAAADLEEQSECFTLGPLDEGDTAPALQRWLNSRGVAAARLSGVERRDVPMHWVYLPPLPSRAEAVSTAVKMRGDGVADIHVLTKGNMAHAISLGIYSSQDAMSRRVRELVEKGYAPSTARHAHPKLGRWLDVVAAEDLKRVELPEAMRGVEIISRPCDEGELDGTAGRDLEGEAASPSRIPPDLG